MESPKLLGVFLYESAPLLGGAATCLWDWVCQSSISGTLNYTVYVTRSQVGELGKVREGDDVSWNPLQF